MAFLPLLPILGVKLGAHFIFYTQILLCAKFQLNHRNKIFLPFLPLVPWVKITECSKMNQVFKFYTWKLFWVQTFIQIRETSKFCHFCSFWGVKITKFSKMFFIFIFYKQKLFRCKISTVQMFTINYKKLRRTDGWTDRGGCTPPNYIMICYTHTI